MMMKAFTLWQPWASLVMVGAKPIEFRKFDYRRAGIKVGQRVALHAGARPVKAKEVRDLLSRLDDDINSTGLIAEKARPLLLRIEDAMSNFTFGRESTASAIVELSAILGTVTVGEPKLTEELMPAWKGVLADSDRLEHCKFAWPMLDVRPFPIPTKTRGWQGFWNTSVNEAFA
jgi:hypothetical protein